MHKRLAVLGTLTAVGVLLLTGCAQPGDVSAGAPTGPTGSTGSVRVETTMQPGTVVFIEGAVTEVFLRDAHGQLVASSQRSAPLHVDGLQSGVYTVDADLRPCDANCGYLDQPTAACSAQVHVGPGALRVTVTWRGADPCTVSTDSASTGS